MNIIEKIFGTHSENELKRIYPIVDRIEALGPEMEALSDEELRGKTKEFKERLKEGETLDDILPEAYAVVREGAHGAALHKDNIPHARPIDQAKGFDRMDVAQSFGHRLPPLFLCWCVGESGI